MAPEEARAVEVQSDDEPLPPDLLDSDSEGVDIPDLVSEYYSVDSGASEGSASEEGDAPAHDPDDEGTVHFGDGSEYGETTAAAA